MDIVAIRTAIANKLKPSPLNLRAYDYVPDQPTSPAAFIYPNAFPYHQTYEGAVSAEFVVRLLIASNEAKGGQAALDAFIAPSGSGSAVAAIESDATLGGLASSVEVTNLRNYGVVMIGDTRYFSAELVVSVFAI